MAQRVATRAVLRMSRMKKISDIVKCKVVSMTDRAETWTLKRIYSRETGDERLMGEGW